LWITGGNGEDAMTIGLSSMEIRSIRLPGTGRRLGLDVQGCPRRRAAVSRAVSRHRLPQARAGPWLRLIVMLFCAAIAVSAFADTGPGPTPADEAAFSPCPAIRLDPHHFGQAERSLICDAAAETRAFFRAHGVDIRHSIRIRAGVLPTDPTLRHIGSYSLTSKTIRLLGLTPAELRIANSTLFGLPLNDTLYQSIVVHELAHAVADQHFVSSRPSLVAQEYIAYVAQLSTMDPATREQILKANRRAPYTDISEMSSTYYAMNPSGFGIKAYLHFISLDDPGQFLRGLLSGDIAPDESDGMLP
jgi:hypothetical protein